MQKIRSQNNKQNSRIPRRNFALILPIVSLEKKKCECASVVERILSFTSKQKFIHHMELRTQADQCNEPKIFISVELKIFIALNTDKTLTINVTQN